MARGYDTYEVDDGLAQFYSNETGLAVSRQFSEKDRTPEWRSINTWKISRPLIYNIAQSSKNCLVFICGTASNEHEVIDLFDRVFALSLGLETLKKRIALRPDGTFGKSSHEWQTIVEWNERVHGEHAKLNAIIIDATLTIHEITDFILSRLI